MNECTLINNKWNDQREAYRAELAPFTYLYQSVEEQVIYSGIRKLLGLQERALCELVCFDHGQITLRQDIVLTKPQIWRAGILELVAKPDSLWGKLYQMGSFNLMRCRLFDSFREAEGLPHLASDIFVQELSRMTMIPAGKFIMGALEHDQYATKVEYPRHSVELSKGFQMSVFPCTQGLYQSVMGHNPSCFKGFDKPVECVSWCDAILFCNALSLKEGLEPAYVIPKNFINRIAFAQRISWNRSSNGYRLPTEAEWEYAARAGEQTLFAGGNEAHEVAWCSQKSTQSVGRKAKNSFHLYDMSGNVLEWLWDSAMLDSWCFSGESLYTSESKTDPVVEVRSPARMLRGGRWNYNALLSRVSERTRSHPCYRYNYMGFRIVRSC